MTDTLEYINLNQGHQPATVQRGYSSFEPNAANRSCPAGFAPIHDGKIHQDTI